MGKYQAIALRVWFFLLKVRVLLWLHVLDSLGVEKAKEAKKHRERPEE